MPHASKKVDKYIFQPARMTALNTYGYYVAYINTKLSQAYFSFNVGLFNRLGSKVYASMVTSKRSDCRFVKGDSGNYGS